MVRLYAGGKMPAARSLYVKRGENSLREAIAPGTYVMRYRFTGSDDTFEADKQVVLTESEMEGGRRFSNVTVRLFTSTDGNLRMKMVPPEQF